MSVRSSLQRFHIPSYDKNAVVQLIAYSGVGFIAVQLVWITLIVYAVPETRSYELTFRYIGMGNLDALSRKWWTFFTYGWCHHGFWDWLSNMLWLFTFGNVVQNLIGYKQVIPIFVYSLIFSGFVFFAVQFFPFATLSDNTLILGAQSGVIGLMAAAITLSPKYRIFLSDYFSIPLLLLAGIFVFLMVLNTNFEIAKITFLLAGALSGFIYIKLMQSGYQPGIWVYKMGSKLNERMNPKETTIRVRLKTTREEQIDKILDKINENGFDTLTRAERDLLKETNR
jgi:membrane associated rhomboid family serine protease